LQGLTGSLPFLLINLLITQCTYLLAKYYAQKAVALNLIFKHMAYQRFVML